MTVKHDLVKNIYFCKFHCIYKLLGIEVHHVMLCDDIMYINSAVDHHLLQLTTSNRPPSIMLENLPKIYPKISPIMLGLFLLCSIMLTVITAVSYVLSSINCVNSFELVALTVYTTALWL